MTTKGIMKHLTAIISAAIMATSCISPSAQRQDLLLSDGWKIQSSENIPFGGAALSAPGTDLSAMQWHEAQVPSTVLGTLTSNGLYQDAFTGMNYGRSISRGDFSCPWWYLKRFSIPKLENGQRARLEFDGISYSANVWLNGTQIASKEEMKGPFRLFSFDVTELLQEDNTLAVELYRAVPGDFNIGFVDWNPRAADESMGIFRQVWLRYSNEVSLRHTAVKTDVDTETLSQAWLTAETTLKNMSGKPVQGKLKIDFDGKTITRDVTLAANEEKTVRITPDQAKELHVRNPRLWWCHNLGTPEMYSMQASFIINGKVSDSESVDFGIRKISDSFTESGHRYFMLNGKKVLMRGAGWTDDLFLRNPDSRNNIELEYVKDMNLNTVRFENIWGTSQNLYDLCDRKGLLALVGWSCFWEWETYTGTPGDEYGCIKSEEDMDLIAASFRDQILWLRNHPSIVAWYAGSDMLPRPELEKRYISILECIDDRPYVGCAKALESPLTGKAGMKMAGPYDYQAPSYWYSPQAPGGAFGFNTETGIGAQLPVKASIMKMIPQECLWPIGKEYDHHCTTASEAMHSLDCLKEALGKRYSKPDNLDGFLLRAHHLDYDGTRAMFEAFRVNADQATGIIQWMLNSAWPSLYWQLYDWYLSPCSGYWAVKKANMPRQLVYNYADGKVYVVNDEKADACGMTAEMELYGLDGTLLYKKQAQADVKTGGSKALFEVPQAEGVSFMFLSLRSGNSEVIADNSYCLSSVRDIHDWNAGNWIRTPLSQHADFRPLDDLAGCQVKAEVSMQGDTAEITLNNTSSVVAFFISMSILDKSDEEILPSFWSDNLISLRPEETRTYTCRLPEGCEAASLKFYGWNVTETEHQL